MTYQHEARRSSIVWVLVADRARARILAGEWPDLNDLSEVKQFVHPEGASHQRDVEADAGGRFQERGGPRHAGQPETDFKHRTAEEFAHQVIEEIEDGRNQNAFGRLVLVAPALFLGVLRNLLPDPLERLVVADLNKDLTNMDEAGIRSDIARLIAGPASQE